MATENQQARITPGDVITALRSALESSKPEKLIDRLIGWLFKNFADPDGLRDAIRTNVDPIALAFNEWHLESDFVMPLARVVFKVTWDAIEEKLDDVRTVYDIIAANQDCRPLIDSPQGRDYLNRVVIATKNYLYAYTWERCPLCQSPLHWAEEYHLWFCPTCSSYWGIGYY